MRVKVMKAFRLSALMASCLTGCVAATQPGEGGVASVANRHWALSKMGFERIARADIETVTVRLRGDRGIDGTAICNHVGTGLRWDAVSGGAGGGISSDDDRPTIMTTAGCGSPRQIDIADRFWSRMETAKRWSLHGRRLRITFGDGDTAELVPVPAPASERRPDCRTATPNNLDCR